MSYAFQKGVVHATTPTSLSTVSYTVSGLGTPAGVLIIATRASALATQTVGWSQSWGVSDMTRQRVCYSASRDSAATGVSKTAGHNGSIIRIIDPATNAVVVEGVFSATVTDGVSIQYTTVDTTAWEITVLLLGGTQCQCYVNDATPPATTGATTVTTSFLSDFVLTNIARSQDGTQANIADYSPGISTRNGGSPQNMVVQNVCDRGVVSSSRTRISNVDLGASISLLVPGDTLTDSAVIGNFTATGFDLSNTAAGAGGQGPNLSFMAVKVTGAQPIGVALHEDTMPITVSSVGYTFPGFRTGALIALFSNNTSANSDLGNGTGGVGVSDILLNTGSSVVTGLTATTPSKTRSNHSHSLFDFWNSSDTVHVAVAAVASQDASGHTLSFTTAPSSARTFYQLAIQEAPLAATGTSAGATSVSGTLTAVGSLTATSAGATSASGTLTAKGAITATSAGATAASGTLTAKGSLTATSAGATAASGTLTGAAALTASTTGATSVSGTLTASGSLTATSAGATAASGTLTGAAALTATSAGATAASGTLTGSAAITGATAGSTSVSGTLTGLGALTGTSAGATAASGTLLSSGGLIGVAAGITVVAGTLTALGSEAGAAAGSTSVSGTLTARGDLSGTSAGSTVVAGTLVAVTGLIGAAAGSTTVDGILTGLAPLTATSAGATSVSGTLTAIGQLFGSANGHTTVAGTLGVPTPTCPTELAAGFMELALLSAGTDVSADLAGGYDGQADLEGSVC